MKPIVAVAAIALATFPASVAVGADHVVHVYNWSDYVGEGVLEDFTKQTGIQVVYDVYDSNEVLETKLLAGGSGYDVVVPSATNFARMIAAGVFQKVDKSKIPNLANMWDAIQQRLATYDPGNEYAVNYMWGTTAIGYNEGKILERMPDAPVDSWDMIFKPEVVSKFRDCGVHLLDSPDDILPAALNYLGLNPDSKDPADIEKAGALVASIAPNVQKFHSSEYINALANGDICLAVGYSGDVLQARDRADEADNNVTVVYSIPKEGALMWFDSFGIPADAPNPEAAHAFINFMQDAEIAARNSNYVYYANGNKASQPLLDEEVIGDPAIYPDEATLQKLFTTTPNDPQTQRVITRAWTRVKTGG
ncbi:MAG: putrescine-binding periplasmic protein [Alphaproteobacteria bacterium]|nr:MAG: putrescine-binding periplasmic protein [Alphaproteobacteria bacterium]